MTVHVDFNRTKNAKTFSTKNEGDAIPARRRNGVGASRVVLFHKEAVVHAHARHLLVA